MSTGAKRKHKTLTLQDKMKILQRLDEGENMSKLAREYGIGRATAHDIKRKRSKIEEHAKRMSNGLDKRKTMKTGVCPKMETTLYTWYLRQRAINAPISVEILKSKAVEFFRKLTNKDSFHASDGWLDRFRRRFGIRSLSPPEKKPSTKVPAVKPFIKSLQEKIVELDLRPEQVYLVQDSWLFWKNFPKTLPKSQEKIGFVLCANLSGDHKLDLTVTGAHQHFTDFRTSMPVFFANQTDAQISGDLLSRWFHEEFVPKVRRFQETYNLPEKALLILDNTTNFANTEDFTSSDGKILTMTLPPKDTQTIQLTNDNIPQMIKSRYKEKLLVNTISHSGDITQCIQEHLNLKNAVFSLAQSWDSIPASNIRSSWANLYPSINMSDQVEQNTTDDLSVDTWLEIFTEKNWQINQEELETWFEENDEDIVETPLDEVTCKEELDITLNQQRVTNDEAVYCFNKCLMWAEENSVAAVELMVLRNLREKVFKEGRLERKQNFSIDYPDIY